MTAEPNRAMRPEDLSRLFVERVNARDLEGLVALYEPDAVLAFPTGKVTVGHRGIREVHRELLAGEPRLEPGEQPRDRPNLLD